MPSFTVVNAAGLPCSSELHVRAKGPRLVPVGVVCTMQLFLYFLSSSGSSRLDTKVGKVREAKMLYFRLPFIGLNRLT
jgi:hypothetical protein